MYGFEAYNLKRKKLKALHMFPIPTKVGKITNLYVLMSSLDEKEDRDRLKFYRLTMGSFNADMGYSSSRELHKGDSKVMTKRLTPFMPLREEGARGANLLSRSNWRPNIEDLMDNDYEHRVEIRPDFIIFSMKELC